MEIAHLLLLPVLVKQSMTSLKSIWGTTKDTDLGTSEILILTDCAPSQGVLQVGRGIPAQGALLGQHIPLDINGPVSLF